MSTRSNSSLFNRKSTVHCYTSTPLISPLHVLIQQQQHHQMHNNQLIWSIDDWAQKVSNWNFYHNCSVFVNYFSRYFFFVRLFMSHNSNIPLSICDFCWQNVVKVQLICQLNSSTLKITTNLFIQLFHLAYILELLFSVYCLMTLNSARESVVVLSCWLPLSINIGESKLCLSELFRWNAYSVLFWKSLLVVVCWNDVQCTCLFAVLTPIECV